MKKLVRRLQYWRRSRRIEADLSEEIESHRAMRQAELERAGMSPAEARDASRRALGNTALAREDARSIWIAPWLDGLRQDVAYALRGLRRNPGFAAAMMFVTALGIGATTTVFGLIDAVLLKPLPVRDPGSLVYLRSPSFSYQIYSEVRERSGDFLAGSFAWNLWPASVDWAGEVVSTEVLMASGDFYSTLGIQPALGRLFGPEDDRIGGGPDGPVVVISHASWQRRFGADRSVIGRTIRIDRQPFTIVGVAPRGFYGVAPGVAPEITIPLVSVQNVRSLSAPSTAWLHIMGRLRDDVGREQAEVVFQRIWAQTLEATTRSEPADRRAKFLGRQSGLEDGSAGFSRVANQFGEPLWILFALVGLLFAVACASAANLLLARGVARQREIAVRLAIGASRSRLIRQLFTESLVTAFLASGLGLLFASWAGNAMVGLMATRQQPIVIDLAPNPRVVLFAIAMTIVTVVICSVLPAFGSARRAATSGLRENRQVSASMLGRWSAGRGLVVSQVAVTMVLLAGAALFLRSLSAVAGAEAGFDRDRVLVIAADATAGGYRGARLTAYYNQMRDRMAGIPGVESVSLSTMPPISRDDGNWTKSIAVDGGPMEEDPSRYVYFNAISPTYLETLGMRLLRGRHLTREDAAGSVRVVVVNEALAERFFPNQDPIGRTISVGRSDLRSNLQIVGVVQNAKYQNLREPARRIAYLPLAQHSADQNLYVEIRTAGAAIAVAEQAKREARAVDSSIPLSVETVSDRIHDSLVRERVVALLASGLGGTALVLACAGLYGLLAYAVSRRSKEIGLRLALGATRREVVWTVLRDCLAVAFLGIAAGTIVALALGRFAATLLYRITPSDPLSIAMAAVAMLAVALGAGLLPARRAARVDPATALRCE